MSCQKGVGEWAWGRGLGVNKDVHDDSLIEAQQKVYQTLYTNIIHKQCPVTFERVVVNDKAVLPLSDVPVEAAIHKLVKVEFSVFLTPEVEGGGGGALVALLSHRASVQW